MSAEQALSYAQAVADETGKSVLIIRDSRGELRVVSRMLASYMLIEVVRPTT